MVGLRPGGFGIFIGVLMFTALIAIGLGLCVSAAVPTVGEGRESDIINIIIYPTILVLISVQ